MMRKIFISLSLLTLSVLIGFASPLTPEEALQRVQDTGTRSVTAAKLSKTFKSSNGEAALYVFNYDNDQGYLVVSADDAVVPLLGYSDSQTIENTSMPPELIYWLEEYANQIQYIRETGGVTIDTRGLIQLPDWEPIAPIIKTKWNQEKPYNNLCPQISNQNAPTGCVATAMAQVMKYFNYPATGTGSVSYENQDDSGQTQTLSMDFSKVTFDWDNMLDIYIEGQYNKAQADAVALLMKAAGYSVEMHYSLNGSGAYGVDVSNSLVDHFGYDPEIRFYWRSWYNYSNWGKMIYDSLKEVGPVIYGGEGTGGAHEFVFDGYQDGYFHINWGWGGYQDGYFLIDVLNPSGVGTGGGSGGYNFNQDAVVNIKPATSTSTTNAQRNLYAYGSFSGTVEGNKLNMFITDTDYPVVIYQGINSNGIAFGIKFEELNSETTSPEYIPVNGLDNMSLSNLIGFYLEENNPLSLNLSAVNLKSNVPYKVGMVYKTPFSDWQDVLVDEGFYNYFYLTKTGSGLKTVYTVDSFPVMQFDVEDLQLLTDLYENIPFKLSVTLVNNNDQELTRSAFPILYTINDKNDWEIAYTGESNIYSIAPGESADIEIITTLIPYEENVDYKADTEFYMGLYDYETGLVYYLDETNPVSINPYPGDPTFTGKIYVNDAERNAQGFYIVPDVMDFSVTTELTVKSGYFFNETYLYIFQEDPNSSLWTSVASYSYPLTKIPAGETADLTTQVSFPEGVIGKTYGLLTYVVVNNELTSITENLQTLFVVSGNSDVASPSIGAPNINFFYNSYSGTLTVTGGQSGLTGVDIYSINGMKLVSSQAAGRNYIEIDVSRLPKEMIIVNAIDSNGKTKSIKVAL